MSVAFTLFDKFEGNLGKKLIDLSADTFKAVLMNSAPSQTDDEGVGDLTQISAAGGYAPVALTGVGFTEESAGVWEFNCDPFGFTASGAAFDEFQYGAIFSDTSAGDLLVGHWARASALTLPDGATYTVTPNANGLFRVTRSP